MGVIPPGTRRGSIQFRSPVTSGHSFRWSGLSFPLCAMGREGDQKGRHLPARGWATVSASVTREQMTNFDGSVKVRNVPVRIANITGRTGSRTDSPRLLLGVTLSLQPPRESWCPPPPDAPSPVGAAEAAAALPAPELEVQQLKLENIPFCFGDKTR